MKNISISKAEHLTSFWYRGLGELRKLWPILHNQLPFTKIGRHLGYPEKNTVEPLHNGQKGLNKNQCMAIVERKQLVEVVSLIWCYIVVWFKGEDVPKKDEEKEKEEPVCPL